MVAVMNIPKKQMIRKSQSGLAILTILLLIVMLLGAISAVVAISRTNPNTTDNARPYASAVLMQSNNFAYTFQQMVAHGLNPTSITYDSDPTYGMLNVTVGGLTPQLPPSQAFSSTSVAALQAWVYRKGGLNTAGTQGIGLKIKNIGTGTSTASTPGNYAVVLTNLDKTVCQEINRFLFNSITIPASGKNASDFLGSVTAGNIGTSASDTTTNTDVTAATVLTNYMQACVSTGDSPVQYVYYSVIEAQ